MRAVYLNADPGIPLRGCKGSSIHVREMLRALAPNVERLTAVCARLNPRRSSRGARIDTSPLPVRAIPLLPEGARAAASAESRTAPAATPVVTDPAWEGLALNEAAEAELDRLAESGDLDVLFERYSLWSVAGARAARRHGVPWFVEVNAPLVAEASRHRSLALGSVASFLERELLVQATAVIAVSDEIRDHVVDLGVAPERVVVIPNGYNDKLFRPGHSGVSTVDAVRENEVRFTIAFVGSLRPWHGLDILIDAFARIHATRPSARLLVVGDGPLREEVRERLQASVSPDAFRLTGAVPHHEVPGWLSKADVAVAPYPPLADFYFSPLKVVEYLAMGLPVVASRIGQVATQLEPGKNALLVEPGDVGELARALLVLEGDPELRRRMGQAGRESVRDRSWSAIAARLAGMFEEAGKNGLAVPAGDERVPA